MELLKHLIENPNYVELSHLPGIAIDLRYASINNFMEENVYKNFNRAFLHKIAADKLMKAIDLLQAERPNWKILVFDALRPRWAQRILWAKVAGTLQQAYVANPDKGSMHNFGLAIDLTLLDAQGQQIDMGTGFDAFTPLSEPSKETIFLKNGQLAKTQIENRKILRNAMVGAGFIQLPFEWWHYDAMSGDEGRKLFPIIE